MLRFLLPCLAAACLAAPAAADKADGPATIADKTKAMRSRPAGVGSNDIGLDRGQLGQERIVRFSRRGNKVLLVQPNQAFRADAAEENERRLRGAAAVSTAAGRWGRTATANPRTVSGTRAPCASASNA